QPRRAGLVVCTAFASRGIGWAALAGQLTAALALGSPRPLEAELLDAVDPLRFALRRARRATNPGLGG
ncbi:MAG: tRNA U-34 5-methylaminomethyl-2-thiouridine biosynthesis protein, partial [Roseateles sp.]